MNMNLKYRVLGVMSGTSLDGIDLGIFTFKAVDNWKFIFNKTQTIKYSNSWERKL